jgi:antitoxin (DNA-binding transcriptional repressor) of toxin-antitoxin stability system
VEAGEEIEVLHHNRRVARLVPVRERRRWIPATEVVRQLREFGPDPTGLLMAKSSKSTPRNGSMRYRIRCG